MYCYLLAAAVLAAAPPAVAPGAGVVLPGDGAFANRAELVVGDRVEQLGSRDQFAEFIAGELPPSDRERWYLVIYTDVKADPESQQLVRDFQNHQGLRKLAAWCKFWAIDKRASHSAEARHLAAELEAEGGRLPAILLYPSPNDPLLGRSQQRGWRYAYERAGYGGDADLLARNLYDAIRREYQQHGIEQCPGPYCPQPDSGPRTEPYQPDWHRDPLPRMDEPASGWSIPDIPPGTLVADFGAAGLVLLYRFGKQKKWWVVLLAVALPVGTAGAAPEQEHGEEHVERQIEPRVAPAVPAEPGPADTQPGVVFDPERQPVGVLYYGELHLIRQVREAIEEFVRLVKLVVAGVLGLLLADVAVGLRLLWLHRRPPGQCEREIAGYQPQGDFPRPDRYVPGQTDPPRGLWHGDPKTDPPDPPKPPPSPGAPP